MMIMITMMMLMLMVMMMDDDDSDLFPVVKRMPRCVLRTAGFMSVPRVTSNSVLKPTAMPVNRVPPSLAVRMAKGGGGGSMGSTHGRPPYHSVSRDTHEHGFEDLGQRADQVADTRWGRGPKTKESTRWGRGPGPMGVLGPTVA